MKRVVSRPSRPAASGDGGGGSKLVGGALPLATWVPTPRQLTLRLRCDPDDPSGAEGGSVGADLAAAMQLARRVRVVEAEMCEYVVEWPTRHGCPTPPPRGRVLASVAATVVHPRRAPALLLLGALVAAAAQAARQQRALRILAHGLRSGDAAAWRQFVNVMLSKVRCCVCMPCMHARNTVYTADLCACVWPRRTCRARRAGIRARATRSERDGGAAISFCLLAPHDDNNGHAQRLHGAAIAMPVHTALQTLR
jgi:hypothetical protein